MGRPKGSKNKTFNKYSSIQLERHIENTAIQRTSPVFIDSHPMMVNYGLRNNYPEELLNLFSNSPTHSAAIKFAVNVIVGDGIDYDTMKEGGYDIEDLMPNERYTWDELLKNIATDYALFRSFAIEIILNNDGVTYSFYHLPIHKVRYSQYNAEGAMEGFYVCDDWTETAMNPPKWIDNYELNADSVEKGKSYLYVYRDYDPLTQYYPTPSYTSAIKAIQTEAQMVMFDYQTTTNNFVPAGMLVLNDVETDEERRIIKKEISELLTGSENANSLMISWRRNNEDKIPEFIPFHSNTSNVNIYGEANERTKVRILAAHQIPDASLCGLPSIGNNGFASEAAKLETALAVYTRLVGRQNQRTILNAINFLFLKNGIDIEIAVKPFRFQELETENILNVNDDDNQL